jgi:transcriptional regulator with XRE-family HTH domain
MTEHDNDDYESDIQFGRWLKEQREAAGLALEQVEKQTGLPVSRIKALETGFAEKGIQKNEAQILSTVYRVALETLLERASN